MTVTSRRRVAVALPMAALLLALIAPAPSLAVASYTFEAFLGSTCIDGRAPASTTFVVRLRSKDGDLKGRRTITTDSSGEYETCFLSAVASGDKLQTLIGGVLQRELVVPRLTMKINRVSDVVSGAGPANSHVDLLAFNCQSLVDQPCAGPFLRSPNTSSTGAYSTDFTSTLNIRGGDFVNAVWESVQGDVIMRQQSAPNMHIVFRDATFDGAARPGSSFTMTLRNAANNVLASTTISAHPRDGEFDGKFVDSAGNDVLPSAGHKVVGTLASDATLKLFNANVVANAATDMVTGTCFASRPVSVFAAEPFPQSGSRTNTQTYVAGVTNASGNFSLDLGLDPDFDLTSGDDLYVDCRNSKGDLLTFMTEVP